MNLKLIRKEFTEISTIGELYIDGIFFCYTLEDMVREVKIHGKTAIPYGTYNIIVNFSNRFKKNMPLLLDVPNFAGVRIHAGNISEHTEGCILLGKTKSKDRIYESGKAVNEFTLALAKAGNKAVIEITKTA